MELQYGGDNISQTEPLFICWFSSLLLDSFSRLPGKDLDKTGLLETSITPLDSSEMSSFSDRIDI